MAFNIENFKSDGINLNGARPTLFEIVLTSWPGSTNVAGKKVQLLAKASSLPQSTINEVEVGYFGRKIKLAGDRSYANWAVTIYNDEDFSIRNGMMNWHQQINSTVPNLMTAGAKPELYKKAITIRQFSKMGSIIYECQLVGAFPVVVGPITLDWDATNQIEMFDVEFAYDYWQGGPQIPDSTSAPNIVEIPAVPGTSPAPSITV